MKEKKKAFGETSVCVQVVRNYTIPDDLFFAKISFKHSKDKERIMTQENQIFSTSFVRKSLNNKTNKSLCLCSVLLLHV